MPIDEGRYATPEMSRVFDEETRLQKMLDVEAALAGAHAEVGNIPVKDAKKIAKTASLEYVTLFRIKEIELGTKHEVVALIRALAERCGSSGAYVHLGATSSDVIDTAMALQLKEALAIIENRLAELRDAFSRKASECEETPSMNFSQHFSTLSPLVFKAWKQEMSRNFERLTECKKRILVGKMSGAVGTQAAFGPCADKIQNLVMKRLGIKSAEISTQIIQRDRYAELVCLLAIVAASLANIAAAVSHLQSGIGEFVKTPKIKGTSGTPPQDDVEKCDTICGLARIVRSLVMPALENITTWHERDLTQSSAERFILPQTCILVDYLLFLTNCLVNDLGVDLQRGSKDKTTPPDSAR